jgi:hypothetical protein
MMEETSLHWSRHCEKHGRGAGFRGGEMEVEQRRNRNHDIIEVNRIRQQEKKF